MSPRLLRLLAGFLAAFVLLAYVPAIAGAARGLSLPGRIDIAWPGDDGLGAALALCLALLLVARRGRPVARSSRPPAQPAAVLPASGLLIELRRSAEQGERVPALARRYRMSQDAVRVAVGRSPSSSAARAERVSRARQRALPAPVPAVHPRPRPSGRTPYQATS
jgi:hypothetical protein